MKNMKIKVLFTLFLGGCSLGFSQIKVSPVEIYNTVVDKGYEIQEVVERLGDYYYASKDYHKAFHWYEKLMKDGNYSPQPINRYRYAVVLQALGKKDEAKKQFNLFEVLTKKSDAPQTNPTPDCSREIIGTVTDAETGAKISGAQVYIFDSAMGALSSNTTDSKGSFTTKKLNCNFQNGFVEIVKKDYDIADVPIVFENNNTLKKTISLAPHTISLNEGDDLAPVFAIDNIHFNYGRTNIRYDASVQLAKIVAFLEANPTVKIAIKVHTDSRGEDGYNMNLTETQAQSIYQWLVSKGISPNRLTAKGYGETQLVNGCENGVPCSEEEHQANKRVEFIIIEK